MASATSEENINKTPDKNSHEKIEVKSVRSLVDIVNSLEHEIESVLRQNGVGEARAVTSKVIQVYKAVLSANVTCEGQSVTLNENELDTTSEYEAVDGEKEHYINQLLMGRLEEQMKVTTGLRKTAPAHIHTGLKKLIRHELKHLYTVQVRPDPTDDCDMEGDADSGEAGVNQENIEERLQASALLVDNMEQSCADMLHKAKDLAKAAQMYRQTESSEFQKAMCETPPTTPEVAADDDDPLHMTKLLTKTVSKKLPI